MRLMAGKCIALTAHGNRKRDLLEWARSNQALLAEDRFLATGTTRRLLNEELGLTLESVRNRSLGGDQQIGVRIVEGEIDHPPVEEN